MSSELVRFVERQDWLEPVEKTVQQAVETAVERAGPVVANALYGTWLGHPVHPVLTDIPLGAWTAAVVLDALDSCDGGKGLKRGADAAVALGLAGAVGSAITGFTDWHKIDGKQHRIGLVHGLLNTLGAGLFAASYICRRRSARESGRRLAVLGYAAAGIAAYLGGHLVYREKIGVDHTPKELPQDFTPVLDASELIEGELKRADVGGVPVVLLKRSDQIFALAETCSHLGGPLAEGQLEDGDCVRCPWHGSLFSMQDGSVREGPATHPQPCLEARIHEGKVEVRGG
ncbi:MAG: Rieske 2Fe-2S domain-containing protein [Bryobacteraceae bacterium]|nr:Rieske 2Fe-2S domain-containing protein [Bryobacterales bacterium]MEB2360727.1 Rieske 2Fe-2S domain-containing protein [Bryobacterales bacterium]NUN01887.1 Rieske 2Fe-2S domain-containing protein [Bryobacteraceae bacterium]